MSDSQVVQLRRRRPPKQEEVLLLISEAAARLKVDESTIRRWASEGIIPSTRLGDGGPKAPLRIPLAALDEWWQRRVEGGRQ